MTLAYHFATNDMQEHKTKTMVFICIKYAIFKLLMDVDNDLDLYHYYDQDQHSGKAHFKLPCA